jgi:hypothetical protein
MVAEGCEGKGMEVRFLFQLLCQRPHLPLAAGNGRFLVGLGFHNPPID